MHATNKRKPTDNAAAPKAGGSSSLQRCANAGTPFELVLAVVPVQNLPKIVFETHYFLFK